MAVGDAAGVVSGWDLITGTLLGAAAAHVGPAADCRWSNSSHALVSVGYDGYLSQLLVGQQSVVISPEASGQRAACVHLCLNLFLCVRSMSRLMNGTGIAVSMQQHLTLPCDCPAPMHLSVQLQPEDLQLYDAAFRGLYHSSSKKNKVRNS